MHLYRTVDARIRVPAHFKVREFECAHEAWRPRPARMPKWPRRRRRPRSASKSTLAAAAARAARQTCSPQGAAASPTKRRGLVGKRARLRGCAGHPGRDSSCVSQSAAPCRNETQHARNGRSGPHHTRTPARPTADHYAALLQGTHIPAISTCTDAST
eukprot:5919667-Pleurochrysis_carterae.AAC.2